MCSASAAYSRYQVGRLRNKLIVAEKSGLSDVRTVIGDRWLALFGHVRRMPEGTPPHDALHAPVELLADTTPDPG